MTQLESLNKQAVKKKDLKVIGSSPVGVAPIVREVNISLPPFSVPVNEPYGDNQILKFGTQFQSDEVINKLNEFADSTIQFGEQLLKRLLQTENELMKNSDDLIDEADKIPSEVGKEE